MNRLDIYRGAGVVVVDIPGNQALDRQAKFWRSGPSLRTAIVGNHVLWM